MFTWTKDSDWLKSNKVICLIFKPPVHTSAALPRSSKFSLFLCEFNYELVIMKQSQRSMCHRRYPVVDIANVGNGRDQFHYGDHRWWITMPIVCTRHFVSSSITFCCLIWQLRWFSYNYLNYIRSTGHVVRRKKTRLSPYLSNRRCLHSSPAATRWRRTPGLYRIGNGIRPNGMERLWFHNLFEAKLVRFLHTDKALIKQNRTQIQQIIIHLLKIHERITHKKKTCVCRMKINFPKQMAMWTLSIYKSRFIWSKLAMA